MPDPCNAVEPYAYNMPARCSRERDHDGPHRYTWWQIGLNQRTVYEWEEP